VSVVYLPIFSSRSWPALHESADETLSEDRLVRPAEISRFPTAAGSD